MGSGGSAAGCGLGWRSGVRLAVLGVWVSGLFQVCLLSVLRVYNGVGVWFR